MRKKYYPGIDLMKFLAALLIVYIHTYENVQLTSQATELGYVFMSIAKIAVPFFFITSGYLFFSKIEPHMKNGAILFRYLKRLLILYVIWSAAYLPMSIASLLQAGKHSAPINIARYIRNFIFVGSYSHLWFFPSLMIAVFLVYELYKKLPAYGIVAVAAVFYVIGMIGNSYYVFFKGNTQFIKILTIYSKAFTTTRNGLFEGFLFVALGLFLSKTKLRCNKPISVTATAFLLVSMIMESFMLKNHGAPAGWDMSIALVPTTFILFVLLINIKLNDNGIYRLLRNCSIYIYTAHVMILSLVVRLFGSFANKNLIFIPVYCLTVFLSLAFSLIALKLEKKNGLSFLKYLH